MIGIKKTSMQDIADYVGVSKNCVSLALNGKKGVSDQLRGRILQAARELNYANLGKSPVEVESRHILVLAPDYVINDRVFYPEYLWEIERAAKACGCNAIIASVSKDEEEMLVLPSMASNQQNAGILVLGVLDNKYIQKLETFGPPLVMVDVYCIHGSYSAVVTDNTQGAFLAVRHLIENGHQRIGFISPSMQASSNYDRWIGYRRAMEDAGLQVYEEYCFVNAPDYTVDVRDIDALISRLRTLPTAWFCANDVTAVSLIHVLRDHQIQVPNDVSVVGFDDADAASYVIPKLTTVRVKRDVICRKAVDLLLSLADGEHDNMKLNVLGQLRERESVRRLN